MSCVGVCGECGALLAFFESRTQSPVLLDERIVGETQYAHRTDHGRHKCRPLHVENKILWGYCGDILIGASGLYPSRPPCFLPTISALISHLLRRPLKILHPFVHFSRYMLPPLLKFYLLPCCTPALSSLPPFPSLPPPRRTRRPTRVCRGLLLLLFFGSRRHGLLLGPLFRSRLS